MDAEQRYTRVDGYDVDDYFVEGLQDLDVRTGIKIAKFIDDNIDEHFYSDLVSTILGVLVMDDNDNPLTFALEITKDESSLVVLSDIKEVSMDEYLDLLNLNK
tara:strand:+ start:82 stop:390 length:309 start_codon:yes stop_codon:yes gene_type:complete